MSDELLILSIGAKTTRPIMLGYIIAEVFANHKLWTVNLTGMLFTKMLWSGKNRYSLVYDLQPLLQNATSLVCGCSMSYNLASLVS
jgi:hypothetical protein